LELLTAAKQARDTIRGVAGSRNQFQNTRQVL
jgi:hypothetical protein